jgi:hypothetical protein
MVGHGGCGDGEPGTEVGAGDADLGGDGFEDVEAAGIGESFGDAVDLLIRGRPASQSWAMVWEISGWARRGRENRRTSSAADSSRLGHRRKNVGNVKTVAWIVKQLYLRV